LVFWEHEIRFDAQTGNQINEPFPFYRLHQVK